MKFLFQFSIKFYSPINYIYFSAFTIGIITRRYFLYSLDPLYLAPSPASTPFRLQACRWYPIPINFNDERGQFNTSWTHCSKVVGNKSYALVTEKCMTQISAGVICYTPACLSSLLCVTSAHTCAHVYIHTLYASQLGNAISFWCAIRPPPGYLVNGDAVSSSLLHFVHLIS